MTVLGCVLFALGAGLLLWTVHTIGWRAMLGGNARPGQPALVFDGPYRLVRHPFLLAVELLVLAGAFVVGGAVSWLLAFLVVIGVKIVAQWEERRLSELFGEAYERYRAVTPALYPVRWRSGSER